MSIGTRNVVVKLTWVGGVWFAGRQTVSLGPTKNRVEGIGSEVIERFADQLEWLADN